MAYSVARNNTWTADGKATPEFFESRGAVVQPSRAHGDYDVFIDGRHAAWIFNSQDDQKAFLSERGII